MMLAVITKPAWDEALVWDDRTVKLDQRERAVLRVVGEEFGELTKAVLQSVYEPHKSTPADVRAEAVQTAAMALRFLASLDRYEFTPCVQHKQGGDA